VVALAKLFNGLSGDIKTLYNNQAELVSSDTKLDEQFAVLTRLVIMKLNSMSAKINMAVNQELIDEVTYDEINAMFMEWETFRARLDFKDHTRVWFTGGDLSELPPAPEPPPPEEAKEDEPETDPEGEAPAGDQFGGDYAEDSIGDETTSQDDEGGEAGEEDALPGVQDADKIAS
jgi:hypothetical protein